MKKLFLGTLILGLVLVSPAPMKAGVDVGISISLPIPIVFVGSPELIVLPETNVYVVPDIEEEIFFYNGWWWRPWEGHWYRSRDYSSGWSYYRNTPSFYRKIPPRWRDDYREHRWRGSQWNYIPVPHHQVQQNWSAWEKSRYWEKHKSWGVEGRQRPQQPAREMRARQPQPHVKAVKPSHQRIDQKDRKSGNSKHSQTSQQSQQKQQQQGKHSKGGEKHHEK